MKVHHLLATLFLLRTAPILGNEILQRWIHRSLESKVDESDRQAALELQPKSRTLKGSKSECQALKVYVLFADIEANAVVGANSISYSADVYSPRKSNPIGVYALELLFTNPAKFEALGSGVIALDSQNAVSFSVFSKVQNLIITGGVGKYECASGSIEEGPGPVANSSYFEIKACNLC